MTCDETAVRVIDLHSGALEPDGAEELRRHLATCDRCAREEREERVLTELLHDRVPRPSAPPHLRAALEARVGRAGAPSRRRLPALRRWAWPAVAAAACCVAVVLWAVPRTGPSTSLVDEAVNDHLRALLVERPDVDSGHTHQVRPWFEGRVDFAPPVPDLEDAGVHLRGGSVGYFLDRRAAILHYQLRLHRVTLLVFRADGLSLPSRPGKAVTVRGINAVLWREGGLGLALASDVNARELAQVAARIAG